MTDPSTSPENEFSYVDKTTGRSIAFTPKRDEAVVTFREPMDADTLNEAVGAAPVLSISEGFNADLGFAAVHVESTEDTDAAARSREALPEVADSIPVMLDENGSSRYFLPDQVTVQFRPEVDDTRARELINEHGSRVVVAQRTPGYYTVAVPADRDVFETIREFSELAEVAFSEPSEVSFNSALYIPDDPEFGRLWGLHNTGQNVNGTTGTARRRHRCPPSVGPRQRASRRRINRDRHWRGHGPRRPAGEHPRQGHRGLGLRRCRRGSRG